MRGSSWSHTACRTPAMIILPAHWSEARGGGEMQVNNNSPHYSCSCTLQNVQQGSSEV